MYTKKLYEIVQSMQIDTHTHKFHLIYNSLFIEINIMNINVIT